jgi:serpin B
MKILALLLSVSVVFSMVVDAQGATPIKSTYQWSPELVAGNNRFALDLYHELSAKPDQPVFFSPYSISTALAMTYAGARGDTATEMAKTLHFTLPEEQLQSAFGSAMKQLTAAAPDHGYQFRIANRLWGQTGYHFLDSFLKITRDDYGAELSQLDFNQTEQARATINAWVEQQTNDKIKDLIPPGAVDHDTRLVLTNAIYFKGDWQLPFNKDLTQTSPFYPTAKKAAQVQMMYQEKSFKFARSADALILEMPYKSGDLSMVVVLPTKVGGLAAFEKTFTADTYASQIAPLPRKEVRVWLPKFKATQESQLGQTLSAMGMPSAFSPSKADFSGMDGERNLFISKVLHKAFVDVDEKGTEAAAATGVIMAPTAAFRPRQEPEEFKADHPFIYIIRDTRSGIILFMGRYTGPR